MLPGQPGCVIVPVSPAWPAMNVVVYDKHIPPVGTTFHPACLPGSVHKHAEELLLDSSRVGILASCSPPISYPHRLTPSKCQVFL